MDGYPRNAGDVPFDIAIDWGDDSGIEEYLRLHVEKIPPFYHVYQDTQPREIAVTLRKHSCAAQNNSVTKTITYVPFDPGTFTCRCENSVTASLPGVEVRSYFADIARLSSGSISAMLVTDVSTQPDKSLLKFLKKAEKLPEGTFQLVPPEITQESVVRSLDTHTGNHWIPGSEPFIPAMTSNTAPAPFQVSASATTYGNVWNAFDRSGKTGQDFTTGNHGFWGAYYYYDPVSLKVDLGKAIRIMEYSLEYADLSGISAYPSFTPPRYWRFLGSNDDVNWELLDERSGITWNVSPSKNEIKKFSISSMNSYRWCKLEIRDSYSSYYEGHVGLKGFQVYAPSGETTIKGAEVDFIYHFNPVYIDHIVLKGDAKFAQRIGTITVPGDTLSPPAQSAWVPAEMQGQVQLWEITVPIQRQTDSIRLGVNRAENVSETAVYYALRIALDSSGTLIQTQQDILVGVNVFYGTDGTVIKLGAGMPGSLVYRSEQDHKLHHIEIICNANAYARLTGASFEPSEEDLGDVTYCRGVKTFDPPELIGEYMFTFDSGIASSGQLIGEGLIHSIHFFREAIETEYDSPIHVRLELASVQNIQESVCYYLDTEGRHHCVSVNHLHFTQAEFNNLAGARGMALTLNLDTGGEKISGVTSAAINVSCLQSAIQP